MIEKDVTESCLQRRDDREGCNGRMIVMEGCQRRMSWQQKKEGGYSVLDVLAPKD